LTRPRDERSYCLKKKTNILPKMMGKKKLSAELVIANKELSLQNDEKEQRAAETRYR